jgi:hypothetical protein
MLHLLPTRFYDARDVAFEGFFPEANPTQAKTAYVTAGAAAHFP